MTAQEPLVRGIRPSGPAAAPAPKAREASHRQGLRPPLAHDAIQALPNWPLRLGAPPTPVPEPALLLDYLQALPANTPAVKQDSPRLFPGRRPSQPMNPGTFRDALRKLGVPAEKGRTSAIRQLVLQAPAPVIAQAPGHHDKSTTRIDAEAGAPWKNHAPGDHTR